MFLALTIFLASIPALVWGAIFYKKNPVFRPRALLTFFMGMVAVLPILFYKWTWEIVPQINVFNYTNTLTTDVFHFSPLVFLPLGSVLGFMFVGVIEEYMKHIVVVSTDEGFFRNIDDAIEFSIIAALGFAFLENILYFYYILEFQGGEVLAVSFVFRAVFSTFAHVFFSGIYGYFYGVAYFADPIWSEKVRKQRGFLVSTFHKVFHLKKDRVFAIEKKTEGLFLAVVLHATFNILLELNLTVFMVPFLFFGYSYLSHLFKQKENLKAYGHLLGDAAPPVLSPRQAE